MLQTSLYNMMCMLYKKDVSVRAPIHVTSQSMAAISGVLVSRKLFVCPSDSDLFNPIQHRALNRVSSRWYTRTTFLRPTKSLETT